MDVKPSTQLTAAQSELQNLLADIDWTQPWFASVRAAVEKILPLEQWRENLNRIAQAMDIRNHFDRPIHYIAQEALPEGVAYEAHISASGGVPTRENLHDFFNALVWLTFPRIKRQLNAIQAEQIARTGVQSERGPTRDAATLFDENAALLILRDTPEAHAWVDALQSHRWLHCFVETRAHISHFAELQCFGHALMEKLVKPYKAITAHTFVVWLPEAIWTQDHQARYEFIDQNVALRLALKGLQNTDYSPLPVAGWPGWNDAQDEAFYRDEKVFRPVRVRS